MHGSDGFTDARRSQAAMMRTGVTGKKCKGVST